MFAFIKQYFYEISIHSFRRSSQRSVSGPMHSSNSAQPATKCYEKFGNDQPKGVWKSCPFCHGQAEQQCIVSLCLPVVFVYFMSSLYVQCWNWFFHSANGNFLSFPNGLYIFLFFSRVCEWPLMWAVISEVIGWIYNFRFDSISVGYIWSRIYNNGFCP